MFDHRLLQTCKFAVIDPSMTEHLPHGVNPAPMVPPPFARSAHLMPTLLELGTLTPVQSSALLQAMDDAAALDQLPIVSIFINTDAGRERHVSHWNSLQLCRFGSAQQKWLRLHDARVLHQLLRLLTPMQQTQLFGPSTALTYWLGGEWLRADRPQTESTAGTKSSWDWPRIERIGLVNRALARASVRSASALNAQGARVEQLLEHAAVTHGFIHPDDLVEFAYRGLVCVPQFDEIPSIKARLHRPDDEDDSLLADRFALVEPQTWAEVALPPANEEQGIAS